MANPNPKTENLSPFQSKWNSGQTKTIRVPIALADQVLEYARQLGQGHDPTKDNQDSLDTGELKEILTEIRDLKGKGALNLAKSKANRALRLIGH